MSRLYGLTDEQQTRLRRMLRDYEAGRLLPRGERAQVGLLRDKTTVRITNASGGTLEKGEVVEFTAYELDAVHLEEDNFWFTGDTPNLTNPGWGVLLHPVPDGGEAMAQVTGPCVALVNVTDTAHKFAKRASGQTHLVSSLERGEVRIDHNPDGTTGTKLCPVTILPTVRLFRGVVSEVGGILGSASGDVLLTSPNKTESVFNPFAVTIGEDEPVIVGDVDGVLTMWYPGDGTTGGATDRIFIDFTLNERMGATTALQAAATVVSAVGTGAPAALSTVTVRDTGELFTDCDAGAYGWAINWGTAAAPDYFVFECRRVNKKFKVTATASICATDTGDVSGSLDLTNITWLDTGEHTTHPSSSAIVVTNPAGHAALFEQSTGDEVWCERVSNALSGGKWQYQIYKVEKHEVTVPTEFRVNTDAQGVKTFQWRGKKAAIEHCGDSDWVDIFNPTEESVVIGGSYDDTTHQYKLTRKKVWVFASDTQTDHVLHTLVAQDVVIANDINGFAFRYTPMTIYLAEQDTAKTPVTYHTGVDCA